MDRYTLPQMHGPPLTIGHLLPGPYICIMTGIYWFFCWTLLKYPRYVPNHFTRISAQHLLQSHTGDTLGRAFHQMLLNHGIENKVPSLVSDQPFPVLTRLF
jgi:hypothetical protein